MSESPDIEQTETDIITKPNLVLSLDLQGTICAANEHAIVSSGYAAEQLIGMRFEALLHADVPAQLLEELWTCLTNEQPWMGVLKQKISNGKIEWFDSFIMPVYSGEVVSGYQILQVSAEPDLIKGTKKAYQQVAAKQSIIKRLFAALKPGLTGKIIISSILAILPLIMVSVLGFGSMFALIAAAIAVVVIVVSTVLFTRPWKRAARQAFDLNHNRSALSSYCQRRDGLALFQLASRFQIAKLNTFISSIVEATVNIDSISKHTADLIENTEQGIIQQRDEIEQVATAMNEMSATVHEVAQNTEDASAATQQADDLARQGALSATHSITSIMSMVDDTEQAGQVIQQLESQSGNIGSVLDVIRSVAEQTNLLALNAAIEAARAGEQGRGFAVVADEVRTLASRTHKSTQEIQDMIANLQKEVQKAVEVINKAQVSAAKNMDAVEEMAEALAEISGSVQTITSMNTQIASAAEEQSSVSEEINRNIISINTVADSTSETASEASKDFARLSTEFNKLKTMVMQFGLH